MYKYTIDFVFKYKNDIFDGVYYKEGGYVIVKKRGASHYPPQVFESFYNSPLITMVVESSEFHWIGGVCFSCGSVSVHWQIGECFRGECKMCGASWDTPPAFEKESIGFVIKEASIEKNNSKKE